MMILVCRYKAGHQHSYVYSVNWPIVKLGSEGSDSQVQDDYNPLFLDQEVSMPELQLNDLPPILLDQHGQLNNPPLMNPH